MTMIRTKKTALSTALALSLGIGVAPAHAQELDEACAYDISYHCAEVEPGDERIASCLYAHTATLTDSCYQATDGVSRLLEGFFDRVETLYNVCADDVSAHCSSTEIGDGRLLQCLAETNAVSKSCQSNLRQLGLTTKE